MASSISSFLCSKLFTNLLITFILLPYVPHSSSSSSSSSSSQVDQYIVFMDSNAMPKVFATARHWHLAILASLTAAPDNHQVASSKLIHSYSHVIDGFSCTLTSSELDTLRNSHGYLHSIKDVPVKPYTTHSVEFLGLRGGGGCSASAAWEASNYGEGMIIGLIDTGVWPESRSFGDHGMGPVPARWRGECAQFNASLCNKKLIGARSFHQGLAAAAAARNNNITSTFGGMNSSSSARDDTGHGTHTASTAAGNFVPDASFFGYAPGVAKGVAPRAHVAMYKVLQADKGFASDTVKAIDQALEDGVDVLSMSVGPEDPISSLYDDPLAIATFAAMEKDVFVSMAGGNHGPTPKTLSNSSPWTLVVAAGSTDRDFRAELHLGNRGVSVSGLSLYPGSYISAQAPIVFMGDCLNTTTGESLKDKIVVCQEKNQTLGLGYQLSNILNSSAAGAVFIVGAESLKAYVERLHMQTLLPAVFMTLEEGGEEVKKYIKSSSSSSRVARLRFGITNLDGRPAPMVAGYSSRGPSPASPSVLKPDITGPGSLILAAWPPTVEVATVADSKPPFYSTLYSDYNIESGTSMACPHLAGVAALIKKAHPDWSPAAIRSAMMTTADALDLSDEPIKDFGAVGNTPANGLDMGAGQVNPNKAVDPGLVYDLHASDYVNLLCAMNFTKNQIKAFTRSSSAAADCSNPSLDLNYPSFIALFAKKNYTTSCQPSNLQFAEFHRTLTNVGEATACYRAVVTPSKRFVTRVVPEKLEFKHKGEKLGYKLVLERVEESSSSPADEEEEFVASGYLKWVEVGGTHVVQSPIVATNSKFELFPPPASINN